MSPSSSTFTSTTQTSQSSYERCAHSIQNGDLSAKVSPTRKRRTHFYFLRFPYPPCSLSKSASPSPLLRLPGSSQYCWSYFLHFFLSSSIFFCSSSSLSSSTCPQCGLQQGLFRQRRRHCRRRHHKQQKGLLGLLRGKLLGFCVNCRRSDHLCSFCFCSKNEIGKSNTAPGVGIEKSLSPPGPPAGIAGESKERTALTPRCRPGYFVPGVLTILPSAAWRKFRRLLPL